MDLEQQVDDTPQDDNAAAAPPPASLRDELAAQYDKGSEPVEKAEPTTAPAPPAEELKVAATPVAPAPPEDRVPERVKGHLGDKWATLDPSVKTAIREYESNIGRMADKYGKDSKAYNELKDAFAPYEDMIRADNGTMTTAVKGLLHTARVLRQGTEDQKTALVEQIIKAYNVKPPRRGADGAPQPGYDPELATRLARLEETHLTTQAQQVQTVRQSVDNDLAAFTGDPANVYIKEPGFLDMMADLIASDQAQDLKSAYEKAMWLHPGIRDVEIAKRTSQANTGRVQAAQRARSAAVSVSGNAPGSVARDPSKMTLRDTLSAAFDGEL